MTEVNKQFLDVNQLLEGVDEDQWVESLESTIGGDYTPPPEGIALARITGYIDLGKHKNAKGKVKDQAVLRLALFDPDPEKPKGYTREVELDDGQKVKMGSNLTVNLPARSANAKSTMNKLFQKIAKALDIEAKDGIIAPSKFLGKDIAVRIYHNTVKGDNGKADRVYVNIRDDNQDMEIRAPYFLDREGDPDKSQPMVVPKDAHTEFQLFLWESPTPPQWASIFIDGEREVKGEDGTEKKVSKNWIQERILSAENFEDSPVAAMLAAQGSSSKTLPKAKSEAVKKEEPKDAVDQEEAKRPADADALKAEIESLQNAIQAMVDGGMEEHTTKMKEELEAKQKELEKLNG